MEHGRSAGVNSEGDWRMGSAGLHLLLVLVATYFLKVGGQGAVSNAE